MTRTRATVTGAGWVWLLLGLFLALAWVWQDIGFYDETIYLAAGRHLSPGDFWHGLEGAPLYAAWHDLLRQVWPDPVGDYFLSWALLVVLLMLLPVLARTPAAWVYALALVCLPVFRIWPYVSLFSAVWLLLGLLWLRRGHASVGRAVALAALACAVAAFARSEFVYGVFAALGLYLLLMWCGRTGQPRGLARTIVLGLMLLAALLGVIRHQSDQGRSGVAFAQHYNLRASERGEPAAADPWVSDYALRVFGVDPGRNAATTRATLGDFLRADPARFAGHVLRNLRDPRTLALILVVGLLAAWSWWRGDAARRAAGIYVLVVSLPAIAASVLIYPRSHYAVTCLPVLLLHAVDLADCARWLSLRRARWLVPLAVLPMLVIALAPDLLARHPLPWRPGLAGVRCLQALAAGEQPQGGLYFDSVGVPDTYLPGTWRRVAEQDLRPWPVFARWLVTAHPDWVLAPEGVAGRYGVTPDVWAQALTAAGYVPRQCPVPAGLTVWRHAPGVR